MDTNRLLTNTVLVTLICTNSVTSRPNPDTPIVFPDAQPKPESESRTIQSDSRIITRNRRPQESGIGRGNSTTAQRPRGQFPVNKNDPLCKDPGSTFCDYVSDYPINEIRKSIPYSKDHFREIFGSVQLHYRDKATEDDLSDEERICSRKTHFFYPKAGKSEDNKWVYVVNDVDYVQAVVAEICENENKPCLYVDGNLPAGFQSQCRQLYAHKRLLALEPTDKKTQIASFKFPSCCVCYIKYPVGWTQSRRKNSNINQKSIRTQL